MVTLPAMVKAAGSKARWFLYLLEQVEGPATYIGVSTDPERRLRAHNGQLAGGARRTRQGRPWRLLAWWGPFRGRGEAQQAEARFKRLRGGERRLFSAATEGEKGPRPAQEILESLPI